MDNYQLNKHRSAFEWAVSKNWKDKNGLHQRIQSKVEVLTEEYDLSEKDIVDCLLFKYWVRGHFRKYNGDKGSLNNWIARYVDLYLNHLIRECSVRQKEDQSPKGDPLETKNWSRIEWIDKDNDRDDPDYQPEILIDRTNPESLLIARETLEFIHRHFTEIEIAYLTGELDLAEASSRLGISPEAFRKRLDRRRLDFKAAMRAIEAA